MSEPAPEPRPDPEPEAGQPEPVVRKPGERAGLVCALLCLAAAVLTMIGSFQDMVTAAQRAAGFQQRASWVISVWDVAVESNGELQPLLVDRVAVNGVPLLVAAASLLAAAVLQTPVARRFRRVSGLVTVAAAAFLTAVVVLVVMQASWWLTIFQPVPTPGQEEGEVVFEGGFGAGVWTLIAAAVLAIAATVPVWRRPRAEPERTEPDTPRLGTPLVVRLPDEPQDPPRPM